MLRTQSRDKRVTEAVTLRDDVGGTNAHRSGRLTSDKSPVRESRTPGSGRGDRGNPVPYRD